ncbi:MAG: UDP-N-acetylmuramate dehydrogenase, partial [Methylophilaceae bacterium]|nr:UDP-N-acetylmuramate dehydrogenase [Methylophilaceae bacterium]
RDGGVRGTVIGLHKALNRLESTEHTVYAEAGITCAKLAKFCAKQALGDAEFFAGIPGTLGGALAMNAGCYGQETWQVVQRVLMVNRRGDLQWRTPMAFTVHYRQVEPLIADEWFVAAELTFSSSTEAQVKQRIKTLLHTRLRQQPLDFPSAGSTFRNPPGDYAARLIEASGLKGYTMGGAQVSPKHANFIINLGHATAHDIEKLIQHIRDMVWHHSGVLLEQEVKVMGEYEK